LDPTKQVSRYDFNCWAENEFRKRFTVSLYFFAHLFAYRSPWKYQLKLYDQSKRLPAFQLASVDAIIAYFWSINSFYCFLQSELQKLKRRGNLVRVKTKYARFGSPMCAGSIGAMFVRLKTIKKLSFCRGVSTSSPV
jgi:hypothetical protein